MRANTHQATATSELVRRGTPLFHKSTCLSNNVPKNLATSVNGGALFFFGAGPRPSNPQLNQLAGGAGAAGPSYSRLLPPPHDSIY